MPQKTWLEQNQEKMELFPERWYLIFRALEEFVGVVDVYGGHWRHWPAWIVLVMQILTDGELDGDKAANEVLSQVQKLLEVRLKTGQWREVGREQQ